MMIRARKVARALLSKGWRSHISEMPLKVLNYFKPAVIDVKLLRLSVTTLAVEVI